MYSWDVGLNEKIITSVEKKDSAGAQNGLLDSAILILDYFILSPDIRFWIVHS